MSELAGKRILVVEDEALIAALVVDLLEEAGAEVTGPAYSVPSGITLAGREIDAAILDVNLRGVFVGPVAEILAALGVPFVFATGYGATSLERWPEAPVIEKPFSKDRLMAALRTVLPETQTQPEM